MFSSFIHEPMENPVKIIFVDHLITVEEYAKRCNLKIPSAHKRIRNCGVPSIIIDGLKLVDIKTFPAVKKLRRNIAGKFPVEVQTLRLGDLARVTKLCKEKKMAGDRVYRNILAGNIEAVFIAGEAFVYRNDPVLLKILSLQKPELVSGVENP